jgi:hypothetical protein
MSCKHTCINCGAYGHYASVQVALEAQCEQFGCDAAAVWIFYCVAEALVGCQANGAQARLDKSTGSSARSVRWCCWRWQ